MKKKILITGGAGFIGSNLASFLINKNISVNILDNLSSGKRKNLPKKINFYYGDIRNKSDLNRASKKCSIIIHLAAISSLQKTISNPDECISNNVVGTVNVVNLCIKKKMKLIFSSTCAVYPINQKKKFREIDHKNYDTPYAISKITGENIIKFFFSQNVLKGVILRFFNVYGKNQNHNSIYSAVIAKFINQARNKKPLTIYNGGKQKRDFINIQDVCRAIFLSINHKKNDIYNIGTGIPTSINHLAKIVKKNFINTKTKNNYFNKFDALYSCANTRKTSNQLKFKSKISLNDGIKKLILND